MKKVLALSKSILVNGKHVSALEYDIEEITAEQFIGAEAQKLSMGAVGKTSGAAEIDYGFHLCLGFAAIIAVNPEIDYSDLKRITGSADIMAIMRIGRNFIIDRSEEPSDQSASDLLSETTPELIM